MTAGRREGFVFVHATGTDSAGALQENRRKIRQQARKHIGNQWQSARLQSLDIRQVVVPQVSSQPRNPFKRKGQRKFEDQVAEVSQDDPNHVPAIINSIEAEPRRTPWMVPSMPHAVGYAAARIRYNFDLSWLSALTISHVGSMRMDGSLSAWIRYSERTFLDLVPAYYASSQLLQRVVDSILAKAAYVLQPCQRIRKLSLRTYGEALQSVQAALVDRGLAKSTEMLCAIRLLQVYELLDVTVPENYSFENAVPQEKQPLSQIVEDVKTQDVPKGWSVTGTHSIGSHAQGMQRLVTMRSPSSFKTELDKSLLCSLLENFWLQAYLTNTDYFLECKEWQAFIRSVFSAKDVIRNPVALCLWMTLAKLPRLLRQADEILQTKDYHHKAKRSVELELRDLKANLTKWIKHYEMAEGHLNFSAAFYQELLGFGLGTLSITCRVLLALDPAAGDALDLEAEAQASSQQTFELLIEQIVSSGFFVGVCNWATAAEWQVAIRDAQAISKQIGEPKLLDHEVFAKWNGMMGRKPHSERMNTPWRKEVDDTIKQFLAIAKPDRATKQPSYTGIVWYL